MTEDATSELADQAKDTHEEAEKGEFGAHGSARHKLRCIIVLSFMSVLTATGNYFSGHAEHQVNVLQAAANQKLAQANLLQSQATDQWAYFQAKGTKEDMSKAMLDQLALLGPAVGVAPDKFQATVGKLEKEVAKFACQKEEIKGKADLLEGKVKTLIEEVQSLTAEASEESALHQWLAMAAVCFTIGTVGAVASLALSGGFLLFGSVGLGLLGAMLAAWGFLAPMSEHNSTHVAPATHVTSSATPGGVSTEHVAQPAAAAAACEH